MVTPLTLSCEGTFSAKGVHAVLLPERERDDDEGPADAAFCPFPRCQATCTHVIDRPAVKLPALFWDTLGTGDRFALARAESPEQL